MRIVAAVQADMRLYKRIGYHDFEGIANDVDERERIVGDLGPHKCRAVLEQRTTPWPARLAPMRRLDETDPSYRD
jgi:hypothetical protein